MLKTKGDVEWQCRSDSTPHDDALPPDGNYLPHLSNTLVDEVAPQKQVI